MYFKIILALTLSISARPLLSQQYNYAPNSIHYCQLTKKYDSRLSAGIAVRFNRIGGNEFQGSFAATNHLAVMINYMDATHKNVSRQQQPGTSSRFGEVGIGFYESAQRGKASVFAGYGRGNIFNNYYLNRTASFDFQRWFLQPAIIFGDQDFEWGVALRFTHLLYSSAQVDYGIPESDLRTIKAIDAKAPFFLPEFGLHAAMNFRRGSFILNLTSLFYDARPYNFRRINPTMLFCLDLGTFYQQKKKKAGQ